MTINSVFDASFAPYGRVIEGFDVKPLIDTLQNSTPLTKTVEYIASEPALERLPCYDWLCNNVYGGMPIQLGWCNGYNTKLNCLEYHRDSEVNLGTEGFVLLVAKQEQIVDGVLETGRVKAFACPADTLIEVYATTLHYAPCHADPSRGFRVMIALPRGTNTDKPAIVPTSPEDRLLWARNKWLLAHADSTEAAQGAWVGLAGDNIDIVHDLNK